MRKSKTEVRKLIIARKTLRDLTKLNLLSREHLAEVNGGGSQTTACSFCVM